MQKMQLLELTDFISEVNYYLSIEIKDQSKCALGNNLAQMHEEDLMRAHKLVSMMLEKLEAQVHCQNSEEFKYLFGEKESAISVLTKLSTMLLKFIPVGQEIFAHEEEVDVDISKQDAEFLEQYMRRYLEGNE